MTGKPHYHGHRQRLRQKLARDPSSLEDYELLELLLGLALPRADTKPLAKELLARQGNLRGVLAADPDELADIKGFGPACAGLLGLTRELWARLKESPVRERETYSGPEAVAEAAMARFGQNRTEEFWVALVDNKNRLMAWECLSRGTVDQAAVYPREVMALALKHQASGLIVVHNHPGGDARPSSTDLELTRRLVRTANDLSIRLLDHIIVTESTFYSFQNSGML